MSIKQLQKDREDNKDTEDSRKISITKIGKDNLQDILIKKIG